MIATWSNAARRRLVPAAVGVGLLSSVFGLGAAAQQAPAATSACAVEHCLSVRLDPAVAQALAGREPVSLEELAEGLRIDLQGEEPLAVRLIAARYDNGRLVRYGVSSRLDLEAGEGHVAPDALQVVQKAFKPVTARSLTLSAVENDLLKEEMPVLMAAFVGEVPSSYLAGTGKALFDLPAPEEDLRDRFPGGVGVIVAIPDDDARRAPDQITAGGALVGLAYDRPARTDAPTG